MDMNLQSATNQQLWTIIQSDIDCPKDLLEQVVMEGFERNLFAYLIKHLVNKMFDRWSDLRKYHLQDLIQLGNIGVLKAIQNYHPGKGSFKTFAFMNIKSEYWHLINKEQSEKRKVYESICSLDVQRHDNNDETFQDSLIDPFANVEKQAITQVFWDDNFSKLEEKEKQILKLFAEGYSYSEIAEKYNYKSASAILKILHKAFIKINPDREKNNLKAAGLATRRKRRVGA
ncbi:sigma-70 family RNA polymerase sigma factor [Metabacillus sp. 84]|uniref:sigma-70 family RNA polymerase sigma factor n=1 Tax=Metabacillus sp. 84 TaxID=3404705 RepID=UPI003CF56C4C